MASGEPRDYQVNLESFRGPLDLLLYLVKRDEVDIRDIPIARVAEQFKEYLDILTLIDVEAAGDFLVMAATLMEIKSKLLLRPGPGEEADELEEDPRLGLVRQLLEYKRFKDAAEVLEARLEQQSQRLPRQPVAATASPTAPALKPVELWDLVSAFGRLLRETMALQPQQIVMDQTPLHVYMEQIVHRLERDRRLPLSALFTPPYSRGRLVGLFLAVLELTKGHRVVPEQPEPFGDIWLSLAAPDDTRPERTTGSTGKRKQNEERRTENRE
jgi:segregation and condensation protein A